MKLNRPPIIMNDYNPIYLKIICLSAQFFFYSLSPRFCKHSSFRSHVLITLAINERSGKHVHQINTKFNRLRLTHLCRMYFPIIINWTSPYPILGLFGGIFHFYSIFKRNFCKQTVENLIRRRFFCGLLSCFALFANVPQKVARLIYGLSQKYYPPTTQYSCACKCSTIILCYG